MDGNKIAPTDRRLKALREQDGTPLPGFALVVFEPAWSLITHTILCRDGHAQERSQFPRLVELARPGDLWLEDRNFCCWNFLHGIISRDAHVLVRQHAGSVRWVATSDLELRGTTETGEVWEQSGYVEDVNSLRQLELRRVELRLNTPTRDKETTLGLLTNLPAEEISAVKIADAYAKRWRIETAFQEIESLLSGEINTLGYPEAALFSLTCAYVAFNLLQCVRRTLEASRDDRSEEISLYYIADDVSRTMRGLDTVLSDADWEFFQVLSPKELALTLQFLALLVSYRKYTKRRAGSRPPSTPRRSTKRKNHVSTAKLLDKKHNEPD